MTDYVRLTREAARIDRRYGDPQLRVAAFDAAVAYLLGDVTLEGLGEDNARAQAANQAASAAALQVAYMAVDDGMTEAQAAAAAHIDRFTLRRALNQS